MRLARRERHTAPAAADRPWPGMGGRLFNRRVGAMLARNTVVSSLVFVVSLGVLWLLVNLAGMDEVIAAGNGFIAANTLHYAMGRSWIFRGTERGLGTGYALFLINAGIGLMVTMGLYALFLEYTPLDYLTARVIVSVFAGLIMFALNAIFNFRQV